MTGRLAGLEVDLGALRRNLARLRATLEDAAVLAVVKAEAYGHGAVPVARALEEEGVDWLGVALVEEGTALREAGLRSPILVLGQVHEGQVGEILSHQLVPTVSSIDQLRLWSTAAPTDGWPIHLKLDTGMHRLGVAREDWAEAAAILDASPGLRVVGLLSHLAETMAPESPRNTEQDELFAEGLALFSSRVDVDVQVHLCSSAGALHRPESRHGLARVGLALYGIDPAGRDDRLEGVMEVKGPVVHVVKVPVGDTVGYGSAWGATRSSRIGVVAVGYGDGYPYRVGGRSSVRIGEEDIPLVGQVNMDMIQVDLTDSEARVGDEATLMAGSAARGPTATQLAEIAQTSVYETLCRFGIRLPRRYLDGR